VPSCAPSATLIEQRFRTTTRWGALEQALALLAKAAKSGQRADIAAATEQLERALLDSRLM
jgi:hypothetical protein